MIITDEKAKEFIDIYNSIDKLHEEAYLSDEEYAMIESKLLRTVIGTFALKLRLGQQTSSAEVDE